MVIIHDFTSSCIFYQKLDSGRIVQNAKLRQVTRKFPFIPSRAFYPNIYGQINCFEKKSPFQVSDLWKFIMTQNQKANAQNMIFIVDTIIHTMQLEYKLH